MKKSILITFWALVGFFIVVVCQLFIPACRDLFRGSLLFLSPMLVFSLLGAVLLVLALREKTGGRLSKFLFLAGASSAGFFVAVLLHNAFYALAVVSQNLTVLKYIFEGLDVFFFFVSVLICPIAFLVGMMGSIVLLLKKVAKN